MVARKKRSLGCQNDPDGWSQRPETENHCRLQAQLAHFCPYDEAMRMINLLSANLRLIDPRLTAVR